MTRETAVRSSSDLAPLDWVFLFLTLVLAGIHLYLGLVAQFVPPVRSTQFVVIGLAFVAGVVVYFTTYWRPLLYLLGAGFAAYLGVLWLFGGTEFFVVGVATGVVASTFFVLAIYLFLRESTGENRGNESVSDRPDR